MLAPKFSLQFLFVLTAGVAVTCYFLWPQTDGITESEARSINVGMLQDDVRQAIDAMPSAYRAEDGVGVCWSYRVKAPLGFEPGELVVEFQPPDGKAVKVTRSGRSGFAFPK